MFVWIKIKPRNAVNLIPTAKMLTIDVRGPLYTSGDQKWPGNAEILNRNAIEISRMPRAVMSVKGALIKAH
jgi:hypothetical protein